MSFREESTALVSPHLHGSTHAPAGMEVSAVGSARARTRRARRLGSILGLATLLLAPLDCARHRSPHLVLVVVDTLCADRLGVYGNPRGLTPFLDRLAHRGVLFRHAYAASSWTCPSVASIFTSRYPLQHNVTTWDSKLPEAERTLAEQLAPRGMSRNLLN